MAMDVPQLSAAQDARERDYRVCRGEILAMLRIEFPGVPDHEEIYQEAWAEALEREARGADLTDPGGLLRTIAWRRARDRLRKRGAEAVDPTSGVLQAQPDPAPLPDEQTEIRLDAALIRHVVETLDDRHAAVIKLRFDCHFTSREIQQRLGVTAHNLENIVTEAYRLVERALVASAGGESPWRKRQRSLLLACEVGLASARQRRQARRWIAEDPACRAILSEIRATLERLAAILPMPLLVEEKPGRLLQLRFVVGDRLAVARDQLADLAARVGGHGPALEQAGSGGLAGLTGSAALKAALICFAAAGGTVVCFDTGILHRPSPTKHAQRPHHQPRTQSPRPTRTIVVTRTSAAPAPKRTAPRHTVQAPKTTTNASAPSPPSPAPTGSTEFGPGKIGSTSAPTEPAAAPSGGGGEFGP